MVEQSLILEPNESVTLSPNSARFSQSYQQIIPRAASEVRDILGLSGNALDAIRKSASPAQLMFQLPARTITVEDLESPDLRIRASSRKLTNAAFNSFVFGSNADAFAHLQPTFDHYLRVTNAVINIITLSDIEVADGATLNISPSTHVVRARKVTIHNRGRIVVRGRITFKIESLEGTRPRIISTPIPGPLVSILGPIVPIARN